MTTIVEVKPCKVFQDGEVIGWIVGLYGPSGVDGGRSYLYPALEIKTGQERIFETAEAALAAWEAQEPAAVPVELVRSASPLAVAHIKREGLYRRMK